MAMIAITTSSSIKVNARWVQRVVSGEERYMIVSATE
jgi:hypothetical protein